MNNFSIFFPIRIWKYKKEKLFRFEPPLLNIPESMEFPKHFLDVYDISKYPNLADDWKLYTIIWAFNPKYSYYLNRGFKHYYILQNNVFPYNSINIIIGLDGINQSLGIIKNSYPNIFLFCCYQYPIINTSILFINQINNLISDVILVNEQEEKNTKNNIYNFLPFKKNKNISFYERNPHFPLFLHIYENKPNSLYWKANQENICIPSDNSKDYKTIIECVLENTDEIFWRSKFLESNNKPLYSMLYKIKPESNLSIIVFYILLFSLFLILILYTILSKKI